MTSTIMSFFTQRRVFTLLLALSAGGYGQQPASTTPDPTPIYGREVHIPMEEAGPKGLDAFIISPDIPGPRPLVLMTHGTNGDYFDKEIYPALMLTQGKWFARRGWTVAIVIRRGYGKSGGKMDRTYLRCDSKSYERVSHEDTKDLLTAYAYMAGQPHVDVNRTIAVGVSSGGFAVVSFGAHSPSGVRAVINFSGGWHSSLFNGTCTKNGLMPAFTDLGDGQMLHTHVPMLWLYANNDTLFSPKYVQQFYNAFQRGGGLAELHAFDKSGTEGHYLFSESEDQWGPIVEDFLELHGLPAKEVIPDDPLPQIEYPPYFTKEMKAGFIKFERAGPHKAFAVSRGGGWAFTSGRPATKTAAKDAVDNCGGPPICFVFAEDQMP